ncbi:prenyltransferase/squalene oxidase repeat-containing protein [Humisphaera borealis]|uniref:Terpene cyclase/mutase family protein n=1 Tax=Humisphaera borealis TaxID=2807512 RepID=A0A7M2X2F7_9BACT|nr:prenyltransferase/squalene oxidase repeat-containing protein [Humisphaera borealis]QOV91947.1 terpene cyclase/mutase family protein [Humisphaera borealis]
MLVLLFAVPARGDRPVPPKLDDAVERALAYLAKQQRDDGWFDHQQRPEGKDGDQSRNRRAITGLTTLAFLSAGHTPDSRSARDAGRYGPVVGKALDAMVNAVPEDGYIGKLDEKPMYTQAIVTLAVAQAYGVEPRADRRLKTHAVLTKLVEVIVAAQAVKKEPAFAGGWRYNRDAPDSDLSLSGWNALALRAAQDAGIKVPPTAIKAAADFVARCYQKEQRGFAYQPGGAVQAGTTSTGVLCLYLLDQNVRPEAADAAGTLPSRMKGEKPFGEYPCYGMFYLTQAAAQASDDVWTSAAKPILDKLVKAQEGDGGWPANWPAESSEPGRVYRTAMATLALTVPYRVLPIYQR